MTLSKETTVTASPDLSIADLGDEAVLLDPKTGRYFGLNEVATRILELAMEETSIGKIVDVLLTEFEVERGRLTDDVMTFTNDLADRGLVKLG